MKLNTKPSKPGHIDDLAKFESIFKEIPAAIALLRGPTFIFEMANEEYLKLVGRTRTIIGKPLSEALPEVASQGFPELLSHVLKTGETHRAREVEVFLRRSEADPNPRRVFLDFTYRRLLDDEGTPNGIFVFAIDVTEKVLSKSIIQLEQIKLESVFVNASAALALLRGPEGTFEKINAAYHALFTNRDLIEKPLLEALPELKGQKYPDLVFEVFTSGQKYMENEAKAYLRRTSQGALEERFFDQTYTRIEDKRGKPYGVLIHAIDVTDRVLARDKLKHALAARDTFLSIASHELKTPISGMKLQAQMMRRSLDKDDPTALTAPRIRKLVDHINDGLSRMNRLVDDMLDISKIDGGRLALNLESAELGSLVRQTLERFSEDLKSAEIEVRFDIKDSNLHVTVDQFRIEQVLTNLITNAIKYAARVPLDIRLERDQSKARMVFRDHGSGISDSDRERIFNRFERLVSANEVSGMGLGLYIARQIVLSHAGSIIARPTKDSGTEFVMELPLQTY